MSTSASVANDGIRSPVAAADSIHKMPTHAELKRTSAAVDLPECITGGVPPQDYLKYGLNVPHLVQTMRLKGDKFPEKGGFPTPLSAAVAAFMDTYRLVDSFASGDVVMDGTLRPYSKVFTRAYLTVRCLFCYPFV